MQTIQTALLSFGMSGRLFHAPFVVAHPGFVLRAVWERSSKKAQELYPEVISYNTLEDLLADEAIDLVIVNTPNATHHAYAKKALAAGKHVLVEKPFTVTVAEAEDLLETAQTAGKQIGVYQNRRWDSDFKTVRQVVNSGKLGMLSEAEIHFDRYKTGLSPKQHKEIPEPGNGVLHDLGSHLIDAALQLFGKPNALFADLRTVRPVSQVSDYMDLLLFYPTLRVRLKSSYVVKEPLPAFILHGSAGSFLKQRADVQETDLGAGLKPGESGWGLEPEGAAGILYTGGEGERIVETLASEPGNYGVFYDALYTALVQGHPLPVPASEGLQVMQVIEAAEQSAREGCRVSLTWNED